MPRTMKKPRMLAAHVLKRCAGGWTWRQTPNQRAAAAALARQPSFSARRVLKRPRMLAAHVLKRYRGWTWQTQTERAAWQAQTQRAAWQTQTDTAAAAAQIIKRIK